MVAMLSASSAGPYTPDMPISPRPSRDTRGPPAPSETSSIRTSSTRERPALRPFIHDDAPGNWLATARRVRGGQRPARDPQCQGTGSRRLLPADFRLVGFRQRTYTGFDPKYVLNV